MGKSNHGGTPEVAKTKKQLRLEESLKRERSKKRAKFGLIAIIAIIAIILIWVIASSVISATGFDLRNTVALETENFAVDNAMLSYYFYDYYNYFLDYYGEYITYYGLDPTVSLKLQLYNENYTWFEYFANIAQNTAYELLLTAEAANAAGVSLTDAELEAIKGRVKFMDSSDYGKGVNRSDLVRAIELSALAEKYQASVMDGFEPTDAEAKEYFDQHSSEYMTYSYRSFPFKYSTEEGDGLMTQSEALDLAAQLYNCTTEDEYTTWIENYLRESDPDITDEEIESEIASTLTEDAVYAEGTGISELAFSEDAYVGATYSYGEAEGYITVYMITQLPEYDTAYTADVRHILLSSIFYGSDAKAKETAQKVYDEFMASDRSAQTFGLLALEYSEDTGSFLNGGLYEDVSRGEMIAEYDEWVFDDSRKAGDCEIIETVYGYHIMFYDALGSEKYISDVKYDLEYERYESQFTEYESSYHIDIYSDKIAQISA